MAQVSPLETSLVHLGHRPQTAFSIALDFQQILHEVAFFLRVAALQSLLTSAPAHTSQCGVFQLSKLQVVLLTVVKPTSGLQGD